MDGQLAVCGEFAAVTLEQHGIGGSERGSLVRPAQPLLSDPAAFILGQRRRQTYHQLAPAVARQPVVMIDGHAFLRHPAGELGRAAHGYA